MRHPLHPAFVHFPIATWSLGTAGDLASLAWGELSWGELAWGEPAWRFAGASIAVGVVTALAAMATGLLELMKLDADHPATGHVTRHMLLMMTTWCCYTVSLFLRLDGTTLMRPDALAIGLSAIGFVLLCLAGWLGGQLVYEHGVGVRRRPVP